MAKYKKLGSNLFNQSLKNFVFLILYGELWAARSRPEPPGAGDYDVIWLELYKTDLYTDQDYLYRWVLH